MNETIKEMLILIAIIFGYLCVAGIIIIIASKKNDREITKMNKEEELMNEYEKLIKEQNEWARMDDNEYTSNIFTADGYTKAIEKVEAFEKEHPEIVEKYNSR